MKVVGANFTNQAVILWNGTAVATNVVDSNTLSGTIESDIVATPSTVQLRVQNVQTAQESKPVSVIVAAPATSNSPSLLKISTATLPSGSTGVPYTDTISAAGGTPAYIWRVSSGHLPAGLALSSTSGLISGTPTASGSYSFGIMATDSGLPAQTATVTMALSVATIPPEQLTISTSALSEGTDGVPYSSSLEAGGGTLPYTWSITSGSLPSGLHLAAGTGVLSGTPTVIGTYSFTASVSDAGNPVQKRSATTSITLAAGQSSKETIYYISNGGNDSNAGTSQSAPWRTITKMNTIMESLAPGDSVLLRNGDVFRDDYIKCLNLVTTTATTTIANTPPKCSGSSTAPITIGTYGAETTPPTIDGADPLSLTWTLVHGTTYEAKISGMLPTKLYMDSPLASSTQLLPVPNMVGEYSSSKTYEPYDAVTNQGSLYVRGPVAASAGIDVSTIDTWVSVARSTGNTSQIFSTTNSGLQNVEATPGSWYATGTTIYVNLPDGSDPDRHTFEGTQRPYGVLLEGVNYVTITGLAIEHVQHSGIASIPFSSDLDTYFVGEYNRLVDNRIWNFGSIITDSLPLQEHINLEEAGILVRTDGSYNPHLVRGNYIGGNNIGIMDSYLGASVQSFQGGIITSGIDGGGTANDIIVQNNYVSTANAGGIIYNTIGVYTNGSTILNNGGRVTGNELVNNQGNLYFTATEGGMEDHNLIHHSYGEGVQTGGNSTSTKSAPQVHSFDVIYHLGKSADGQLFNGFDCKGTLAGGYWTNNTVYDTNSAAITFEDGCNSAHVHNNIFDQNALRFPAYDIINPSYLLFFVPTSDADVDFSNNLWVNGTNFRPFSSLESYFTFLTYFSEWPDHNSSQVTDPLFKNPAAGDFSLLPNSPAIGKGVDGATMGAMP